MIMNVIISGGGTGGHINPGVAIAKKLKEKHSDVNILFIGTENGLERKMVPKEGFKIKYITVEGLNKKISLNTIKSLFVGIKGFTQSGRIIKEFKPDLVIGTGGYVCGPVVLSAYLKGIPTIIHEQNAIPGVTNKLLSKFATSIAISFKESEKYFPKNRVHFTGNPIKDSIINLNRDKAREVWGLDRDKPILFVVGGSRGARNLNEAIADIIPKLHEENIQLIFATGENQYEHILKRLEKNKINIKNMKGIKLFPFLFNMHEALGACDLIISRAGATTLSEITAVGIPAILVPSPYVANNHQEYNAIALEENGAAILIKESQLANNVLFDQINNIIKNKETLKIMAHNSKKLAMIEAADNICDLVDEIFKDKQ
jgi:UDP-N-acetylglucosamine--N-acetylmuramyl-(pentapeptide) pyrophosphoryl-undecaprenol N-acetylglucosamine transferase